MRFHTLAIGGAWLIELEDHADDRGSFARTFCAHEFGERGLVTHFPQHSRSRNHAKGTLRGMHYQKAPYAEAKLVSCTHGAIFDVCLDLRPDSPTYLKWQGVELTPENGRQLYIPEGCAHGFQTLKNDSEVFYRISAFHDPSAASGVRYNDSRFGIAWPLPVSVISGRDRDYPDFLD
jgi:dTDP-4-dehydrorhamnose 3,5-epimerase